MEQSNSHTVAVFGDSRVRPGSSEYEEAFRTGKLLAQAGFTVMNGGYAGTMEASARGAKEGGGRAVGVISNEFERLSTNAYLDETVRTDDLFARIRKMQQSADGFVVLRGSMGTLAELALVWNLSKIDARYRKPIVLVGNGWSQVLRAWREYLAVTEDEARLLHLASVPEEAVEFLRQQVVPR